MAKYFIDLGSHNGQTLLKAYKDFPKCKAYIGVEPFKPIYNKSIKKTKSNKRTKLYNAAVDLPGCDGSVKLYIDEWSHHLGCSIFKDKHSGKGMKKFVEVPTITYEQLLKDNNIKPDDSIILKVDIEGKEYDILEHIVSTGLIKQVKKLYVEWHWNKIKSIAQSRHDILIKKLNKLGFNMSGSKQDEYYTGL